MKNIRKINKDKKINQKEKKFYAEHKSGDTETGVPESAV